MKHSVEGKVVVVTGAAAGVGRAAVRAFAERGADVALIARGRDALEAAAREVEAHGRRALVLPVDVADAAAVERAADEIEQKLGPIEVWVNDAMVSVFGPFLDITPEEFRRVTDVTYLGYVHGTAAALRRMKPRDRGTIVQVGSALAYRSIPLQSAYCAAKHAVHGLTESIRTELLHDKSRVHITAVELPAVNTPQFTWSRVKLPRRPQPVPPIFQPEVVADAIVYAAEHRRREIWLAWPSVKAIISDKLAPRIGDLYLAKTGYKAQQTDEPVRPDRPDDLYDPVPGDAGAHGEFDARAKRFSAAWWLSKHRAAMLAGLAVVAGGTLAYARWAA
ncbi:MAG TPA: SDR family oxidoreductase [Polyangiaceae bacterium]|nr:SDR family oxidoreductase [Polyangiaceae bacterium]